MVHGGSYSYDELPTWQCSINSFFAVLSQGGATAEQNKALVNSNSRSSTAATAVLHQSSSSDSDGDPDPPSSNNENLPPQCEKSNLSSPNRANVSSASWPLRSISSPNSNNSIDLTDMPEKWDHVNSRASRRILFKKLRKLESWRKNLMPRDRFCQVGGWVFVSKQGREYGVGGRARGGGL